MATLATPCSLAGVDDETAALLLQVQLEDVEELLRNIREKGKSPEGVVSDTEISLQLQKEELQRNATILADRQMTKSIARAVIADGRALAFEACREMGEAADRAIALRIEGGNPRLAIEAPPAVPNNLVNEAEDEFIDKLSALYVETPIENPEFPTALVKYKPDAAVTDITAAAGALVLYNPDIDISDGESSAWAASRQVVKISRRECIICLDKVVFFEVANLPCGHGCCRQCLEDMFTAATIDESRYPPRCCDSIPTDDAEVRLYVSSDIMKKFEDKKVEWECNNRVYCSNGGCGIFIHSEHIIPGLATCPACSTITCTICKEGAHDGDCPKDEALQQTLRLLEENHWRRCGNCRTGIELRFGCHHITCACKAEFCYLCGARWKTCACVQWDEQRLLLRAEEVADRGGLGVDAVANRLRLQADCRHNTNRRVREPGQCEDCHDYMRQFIMECTRCYVRRCLRCT